MARARRAKEQTYPELSGAGGRARLVVIAGEVGGRWSTETWTFLGLLAKARARSEPRVLRRRAEQAWMWRWSTILACAAGRAFAESLLGRRGSGGQDGATPQTHEVVTDARFVRG